MWWVGRLTQNNPKSRQDTTSHIFPDWSTQWNHGGVLDFHSLSMLSIHSKAKSSNVWKLLRPVTLA